MHPLVIGVPVILVISGILLFLLLPLPLWVRGIVLAGELAGALLVGFILWRRHGR